MAKKLSKKALKTARSRHNWGLQWCWNYERMQAVGYAWAMVPIMKELYEGEEEQCRQLERHMQFYNCHPGGSALIMGANVALEENYATEAGDSLKIALMGPLAAIGDTIQAVLITPPFNVVGAGLAAEGNWLSIVITALPIWVLWFLRIPLFNYGYKQGAGIIGDVDKAGSLETLQTAAGVFGLTVVGGIIPSVLGYLRFKEIYLGNFLGAGKDTPQNYFDIQKGLDNMFPYFIPIAVTYFCYWMIKIKKQKPLITMAILAVIAFVLGAFGIMA